jgi:aryl-alcohol dehydrogenase-like predicted oxidoreductase
LVENSCKFDLSSAGAMMIGIMWTNFERATLGRTGLDMGRLGISASYGMPAAAVEEAVEAGVNYLYWGSLRRGAFGQALRNLAPQRDKLVILLQSYSRVAGLVPWSVERGLRAANLHYADVLLLGLWNRTVPPAILDACLKLKDRGLVRFLALSTHNRRSVPVLAGSSPFDIVHLRYNAVHTGAERDVFPQLPAENAPGLVAFTATSWKQLLGHRRIPRGERTPTAADCYRFVLSNPAVDVCMTGAANMQQWRQALAALHEGPMSAEELAWMRRVGDAIYAKPRR